MKVEKMIYCISGYITPDDNSVVVNIYKLIELGSKKKQYIWVRINGDGGIGTLLEPDEYFGREGKAEKTCEDAIIKMLKHTEEYFIIERMTFEDMLKRYSKMCIDLQIQLKEEQNEGN